MYKLRPFYLYSFSNMKNSGIGLIIENLVLKFKVLKHFSLDLRLAKLRSFLTKIGAAN